MNIIWSDPFPDTDPVLLHVLIWIIFSEGSDPNHLSPDPQH